MIKPHCNYLWGKCDTVSIKDTGRKHVRSLQTVQYFFSKTHEHYVEVFSEARIAYCIISHQSRIDFYEADFSNPGIFSPHKRIGWPYAK